MPQTSVTESNRVEILGPNRDINSLEHAAYRANLPVNQPTDYELGFFPEIHASPSGTEVFLLIRNTTIAQWHLNITQECVTSDVMDRLRPPFNADEKLIDKIVRYLTRHGIINFGLYQRKTQIRHFGTELQFFAVVIGAGISGIAAALQLVSFGFKVVILEGRQVLGGRCKSFNSKGVLIEAGCDLLRDLDCSPIQDLLCQIETRQYAPNPNQIACFSEGVQVEAGRERLIKGMYDNMHGALAYLAHQEEQRDERNYFISRQRAYENVLQIVERKVMLNYFNYCNTSLEIAKKRELHYNNMRHHRNIALMAEKKLELKGAGDALLTRSLIYDIRKSLKTFEKESEAFDVCEKHLVQHRKTPCCGQYMRSSDFNNYNFVLGCEELCFGTMLEKVQFSTATAEPKWNGPVTRIENGISTLLKTLTQQRQIDIRGNKVVTKLDTSKNNTVVIECQDDEGNETVMEAAMVVSTLPIGVLKKTIQEHPQAPVFVPPLPQKKVDAIHCIGSAVVNKIILIFERNFWETTHGSTFAHVASDVRLRACMNYWSSTPGSTVLNTYFVGEDLLHESADEAIIAMAMMILHEIFPICAPKTPLKAHVTRWHKDPLAFGTGSFKGLRTELHHYDDLIVPLKTGDGKNRVYFAGEHTSREHCNTLKGAWLSGMRVANEVATDHNGSDWINFGNEEIVEQPVIPIPAAAPEEEVVPALRRIFHRPPRQSMQTEQVERPATATATIQKVKPLPPLHQLLMGRPDGPPRQNRYMGYEFGCLLPDAVTNSLSASVVPTFTNAPHRHVPELIDLEDPNQPSTSSAPVRRSMPLVPPGQFPVAQLPPAQLQSVQRPPVQHLPVQRAPVQRPPVQRQPAQRQPVQRGQQNTRRGRGANQPRRGAMAVPRPRSGAGAQYIDRMRLDRIARETQEAAARAEAASRAAIAAALARRAAAAAAAAAEPSTSGPRPNASQYMSSRPSTSSYANPARQVPPTRPTFAAPSSSQPSTSRGPGRLPERPPSSMPARPPGSRMPGGRK